MRLPKILPDLSEMGRFLRLVVGAGLLVSSGFLGWWLYRVWGRADEQGVLLQVMLMGALGSHIIVSLAFAQHAGRREFDPAWVWWYPLRLVEGGFLAILFYVTLRAKLLGVELPMDSPWAANSYAGLVGMFSHTAIDKLGAVFGEDEKVKQEGED